MTRLTKRSTIYLAPELHQALRIKSLETSRSMSKIINEAVKEALCEDEADLAAFDERRDEPLISYDQMDKSLKKKAGYKISLNARSEPPLLLINQNSQCSPKKDEHPASHWTDSLPPTDQSSSANSATNQVSCQKPWTGAKPCPGLQPLSH